MRNQHLRAPRWRHTALAMALGMSLGGVAYGQATTGSIFGQAQPGDMVTASSSSGVSRTATADASGRYTFNTLPVGTYTVTLSRNGQTVSSRDNVGIAVGKGTDVSFANASGTRGQNAQNLEGLTVSANALPAIDVTSTNSSTVITSEQLKTLPIARSAESIALLAPGATRGSSYFAGPTGNALVSFGGSAVTENSYYINGMNVTDPLSGLGGIQLPYGAIDQEEVLTGGYGAAYGRSDGGVINQIGKRGTNEWHFGAQVLYTPQSLIADPRNIHYPNRNALAGQVRSYKPDDKGYDAVVDGYAGGPLIKDTLYLFAAAEAERRDSTVTSSRGAGATRDQQQYRDPKYYAKLDWNINDSNILELTGAGTKQSFNGNTYRYNYNTYQQGAFLNADIASKTSANMWIAKYTGYITDDLTVNAQFGKQVTDYYQALPNNFDPTLIYLLTTDQQDPRITGGRPITNTQTIYSVKDPSHQGRGANYRFDVTYKLGDHTITAGIDNQRTQDLKDQTTIQGNAGYAWQYGHNDVGAGGDPETTPISGNVGAPGVGSNGYYVARYRQFAGGSVKVDQRAQYIQDAWQVTDRLLLNVGLRNDQFNNYNSDNETYIHQHSPQWAPRLGASWDVFGDSSFKVYGNAGRYYLALPTSLALRGASGSVYTQAFYTYTGITPEGYPTGLKGIPNDLDPTGNTPISPDGEYGQSPIAPLTTSRSLKAQYQDEYILGFDKSFSFLDTQWAYGAKGIYRDLKNETDDTCDKDLLLAAAAQQGYNVNAGDPTAYRECRFFNPGRAADFVVKDVNGNLQTVHLSNDELGFPHAKRSYAGLNLYLSHPFDGKWFGRIDYTFSHSYGNSEGQVRSDIGQSDVAATEDWDFPSLEVYANGDLANDRKHQLKAYGGYQFTPEWNVSTNISLSSGTPRSCLGLFGADQTSPAYPGNQYHYCNGLPSPPGKAGRTPWQHIYSLNVEYRPAFAEHKLAFALYAYNIFDNQVPLQQRPSNDTLYGIPLSYSAPRSVRFGMTYDF